MRLRQMAQALGRLGGRARAKKLTAARRKEIASMGGRSKAISRVAADRIRENFRYLEAVEALGKVRGRQR